MSVHDLPIDANEWQHLVFLKRKNSLKFYLNGGQVIKEQPIKPIDVFCERELWIGCNNLNNRHQNYEGVMDELRMYNRALSNDEVRALYEIYKVK